MINSTLFNKAGRVKRQHLYGVTHSCKDILIIVCAAILRALMLDKALWGSRGGVYKV